MPNNYGDNPPLSYNKYLRVQDLINLQDCLSDPAHHDELELVIKEMKKIGESESYKEHEAAGAAF